MVSFTELWRHRSYRKLLAPLAALAQCSGELAAGSAGRFTVGDRNHHVWRFHFRGPETGTERVRIGLFAGLHGDEPAGCAALVRFVTTLVDEPSKAAGFDLFIYPVVNPTGFEDGTRENRAGLDLNREFWRESDQPEVRIIERELVALRLHGLVALHADDTCEGNYGYSHGRGLDDALLRPALEAAERALPRDRRSTIDGFAAHEGVICECFPGVLAPPPLQDPHPFNLIFETPGRETQARQVAAGIAALEAILTAYRGLFSYAQNL